MKLRIKGNSLRIRLTRSEVVRLTQTGYLEEQTLFGKNRFVYALQRKPGGDQLSASLEDQKITMHVPDALVEGWVDNNVVGFDTRVQVTDTDSLYLLLEKDFVCLDETVEDQSDHFENPAKSC